MNIIRWFKKEYERMKEKTVSELEFTVWAFVFFGLGMLYTAIQISFYVEDFCRNVLP